MDADGPRAGRPQVVTAAAIAGIAFAVYLPALTSGFTSDDFFILARVKAQHGLAQPLSYFQFGFFDYFRPLAFLSHAADWSIWGANPFGFHLTNVILHAANTLLVLMIGRRLLAGWGPSIAAVLFALHPASHEAVYWIAARFDLLATFFTLAAIWCVGGHTRAHVAGGASAFGLALLSKESAIALLVIAPAWDVFVSRRGWRAAAGRLLVLAAVAGAYAIARSEAAELAVAGGGRRLPKLVMLAAAMVAVVVAAWWRDRQPGRPATAPTSRLIAWFVVAALILALGVLLSLPATFSWVALRLGFAAFAAFYALSPIVFPAPAPAWFSPSTAGEALPGLAVVIACAAIAALSWRALSRRGDAVFLLVFVAAALVPVSSMTGGLRYLYLPTAGVALFAAWLVRRAPRAGRLPVTALLVVMLAGSVQQLLHAGRAWRAASEMTREGVALMAAHIEPCGSKDVLLLTAPVGIGDVYANFYWEAFDVLAGCSPRSLAALLRVVRTDARVDLSAPSAGVVELRVPDYGGNIVASADLRNFVIPVPPGYSGAIDTPVGRLEVFPEGSTQVFRLAMSPMAEGAERFYYSAGRIRR